MPNIFPVGPDAHETKVFQPEVTKLFKANGWENIYHTHDSRRSEAGFPDVLAIKGGYLLVAELKAKKGKTSDAQDKWLTAFEGVQTISVRLWKPGINNEEIIDVATTKGNDPQPPDEIEGLRLKMLSTCEHGQVTYECAKCMKGIADGLASVVEEK